MNITEEVLKKAKELGCDLAGIAPVERFKNAPLRMSPKGLLPSAKSVIVAGIHHLDASVEMGGEPTPHDKGPYASQSSVINPKLDDISFLLARFLEGKGYTALPITASNIWRYHHYKDLKVDFAPDLAHRYSAVAAGLGEIGWSGLFLSPQFGPRQRVISIITEAELKPTPMYDGPPLCDKCFECVKTCPTDAFRKEVKKINEIEIGGKIFKFPEINKWRCAWAENFGLNLSHKIPEKVDEKVILEYLERYGMFAGEEGSCLKFCMVPEKRYYDTGYCRAPRRKKQHLVSPEKASAEIRAMCENAGADAYCILPADSFSGDIEMHPALHMPDAASVISIGMDVPLYNAANREVCETISRRLYYLAFDIAHYFDVNGYSGITQTKISNDRVAQKAGLYRENRLFMTVLVSAKMKQSACYSNVAKGKKTKIDGKSIKDFCLKSGADIAGIFNTARFEEFSREFEKKMHVSEEIKAVKDKGCIYGQYVPEIYSERFFLKTPASWLKNARSVIVLGLHFPDSALDTAKVTPAETVGPYAFVQYESLRLLKDAALKVVRHLKSHGYRAVFTADMTGLASITHNPREVTPDMRANLYPAMLAGLAYPGLHGCPITEKFGVRQRFLAIVTDCPLENDPLYAGEYACSECGKPCISHCPTKALKEEFSEITVEGKKFRLPSIDNYACEWAKRYVLSGKEGPEYYGLKSDTPVPEKKNAEAIVKAVNKIDWGVQKRLMSICEECIKVCPEKGE
ncbi:MAG: hypothetical protein JW957_00335 [Candidatus Omnitrophica bacterium]|nr:hypothetical protein [Candidatus Omnitrophota bacterium]